MGLPESFAARRGDFVCKLQRSLYGLGQAPRNWSSTLKRYLVSQGFRQSQADHCVYITDDFIVLIYVYDLLVVSKAPALTTFKAELSNRFKMTDLGHVKKFLGIEISRSDQGITPTQVAFTEEILERFSTENSSPVPTPIVRGLQLDSRFAGRLLIDPQRDCYQQAVGCLLYLALGARPVIGESKHPQLLLYIPN